MALATHQVQGSYTAFPLRASSCDRQIKLKQFVSTIHMIGRIDVFPSLKCRSCLSVGAPTLLGPKRKPFKISVFKGSGPKEESEGRASGSKSRINSVKLSYVLQENKETLNESQKVLNLPLSCTSEREEVIAASLAVQCIFRRWLTILHTPTPNEIQDEIIDAESTRESMNIQSGIQKKERGELLKAVWCSFLGLDASLKIPLLIFVPCYMAVRMMFGAEVSKELTPLWVLGPLAVSLYIRMFRALCALYVFSIKQAVKVFRSLPIYYAMLSNYIACGNLKEDVQAKLWQPVLDSKNQDYKEISRRKMKDLESWLVERYLDFVESIWPYYCRTIRFLKRGHLI